MLFYLILATLEDDERNCAENIFVTYEKKIYEIAHRIVKNHHDAEDTLDRVMIDVMENIDKFLGKSRNIIEAQIVIYTRNEAINTYNRNKRKSKFESPSSFFNEDGEREDMDLIDDSVDVEQIILNRETVELFENLLLELSQDNRDTIKLVYLYGYSYKEAAKILHITPNAVALRLQKAKKKLIKMAGGEFVARIG